MHKAKHHSTAPPSRAAVVKLSNEGKYIEQSVGLSAKDEEKSARFDNSVGCLSEEQKHLLSSSEEIKQLLKSKRLRDQIKLIDSGSFDQDSNRTFEAHRPEAGDPATASNGKARQKCLKRMRERDKEFDAFVEKMLSVISYR